MNSLRAFRAMGAGFALVVLGFFAHAATGLAPTGGLGLVDAIWLNGLAGGQNFSYQSGIIAKAAGTQTTCTVLTPGIYLYEVDTAASSGDSICVPFAIAGTNFQLRNAGAQSINVFALSGTNAATASTDQINGSSNATAYALPSNQSAEFFSAKNGQWSAVHGN